MNASIWNKRTSQAYAGTVIYALFGILVSIIGSLVALVTVSSALTGNMSSFSLSVVILALLQICVLAGYLMFFFGIKGLRDASAGEPDAPSFDKMYIAAILSLCGSFVSIFPIPVLSTIIAGCLKLAAVILLLIAYSNLKRSAALSAFSPAAAAGFGTLFTAELLSLIGSCISWIPLINFIGAIFAIVAFVLTFVGWKKVATPVVEAGAELQAPKSLVDLVKESVVESVEDTKAVFNK